VAALQEGGDQRLLEVFQLFDQSSDMEAMAAEECKCFIQVTCPRLR
jgi:hypothetical protein